MTTKVKKYSHFAYGISGTKISNDKTNTISQYKLEIGQILKKSEFKGNATYQKAILLVNEGIGKNWHGYREEFIRLAEYIEQLTR